MLAIILARILSQIQLLDAVSNIFPTPKTFFIANTPQSTTLANAPASTLPLIELPKSLSILLALKTFFINVRPIPDLNGRLKTREPLQTIFSNIW